MNKKKELLDRIEKYKIGKRLVREQDYRKILIATFSFASNLLYAIYHGVLGAMNQSLWFMTMCAYYLVLSVIRFSTVLCGHKVSAHFCIDTEYFMMKLSGVLLVILSLVLTGVSYISLSQNIVIKYDEITMITIATYTFFKITMAIIEAVRQRNQSAPLLAVIRNIRYAEVAASVLTLQRSMLASFGDIGNAKANTMTIVTGAAVCIFVCALGIAMLTRKARRGE